MNKANRDLNKLEPNFKKKVEMLLKEVGDTIFVTEGYRSQERQDKLYAYGRTNPGVKITWTKTSVHTKGLAIDIAFKGKDLYPKDLSKWGDIYLVAKRLGIDWGFNLWEKDKPHFQCNGKPFKKTINYSKFGPIVNGVPETMYGIPIKVSSPKFTRVGMVKLKGFNTKGETTIIVHPNIVDNEPLLYKVLNHEFAHIIFHTVIKKTVLEAINYDDMKLSKYEYWDYISNNLKYYITDYAKTNSAEDFAELVGYSHYINNKIRFPKKATFNRDIKFKYLLANNIYKWGLKEYLKGKASLTK